MQETGSIAFPAPAADELLRLEDCVVEPIRVPGGIQPHGALLTVDIADLEILQATDNTADTLGIATADLLGSHLDALLAPPAIARMRQVLAGVPTVANPISAEVGGKAFDVIVSSLDGVGIVEFEPTEGVDDESTLPAILAATRRIGATSTVEELRAATARELFALTGYDQVLIYHFHPDGHGEVVAEEVVAVMEPYLGLHFPASDIPAQARQLYLTKLSRVIASSSYEPAALVPAADPRTGTPVDLTLAELRSVSPHHLQFMRNMGQGATLSFSLISNGELIGMITCAHRTPRRVGYLQRQAYEILAHQVALQLTGMNEVQLLQGRNERRLVRTRLGEQVAAIEDVAEALLRGDTSLGDLVPADGVAVVFEDAIEASGDTPPEEAIRTLIAQLALQGQRSVLVTDGLPELMPEVAEAMSGIAGLLAFPFGAEGDYLLWFRREVGQTVNWMGDMSPSNRLTPLSPRNSFSMWTESVTGRSLPWQGLEAEAAELSRDVDAALLRRAESQLSHLGLHDALTDLPNRRLLMLALDEALGRARGTGQWRSSSSISTDSRRSTTPTATTRGTRCSSRPRAASPARRVAATPWRGWVETSSSSSARAWMPTPSTGSRSGSRPPSHRRSRSGRRPSSCPPPWAGLRPEQGRPPRGCCARPTPRCTGRSAPGADPARGLTAEGGSASGAERRPSPQPRPAHCGLARRVRNASKAIRAPATTSSPSAPASPYPSIAARRVRQGSGCPRPSLWKKATGTGPTASRNCGARKRPPRLDPSAT
ncbi:hypothetical protein GCM10025866_24880 [Naasia aerilata]|uniref:Phytochrome chromophore attachment site domain-containing protein n=1 Tax=Naasia aerilata TaxID=1162966 RepID=A0ABN6XNK8_9MICO|nr:GAF domain-containing protein [Naasia aerilata]BDZ46579.1 hypothetical protein GCM10025866_24880 [Naasia aerilata]